MQCGIDCNITVEFIPAIMMGRGDFISAGAVAVRVGEQRSVSGEGRGRFPYAQYIRKPRGLVNRKPEC